MSKPPTNFKSIFSTIDKLNRKEKAGIIISLIFVTTFIVVFRAFGGNPQAPENYYEPAKSVGCDCAKEYDFNLHSIEKRLDVDLGDKCPHLIKYFKDIKNPDTTLYHLWKEDFLPDGKLSGQIETCLSLSKTKLRGKAWKFFSITTVQDSILRNVQIDDEDKNKLLACELETLFHYAFWKKKLKTYPGLSNDKENDRTTRSIKETAVTTDGDSSTSDDTILELKEQQENTDDKIGRIEEYISTIESSINSLENKQDEIDKSVKTLSGEIVKEASWFWEFFKYLFLFLISFILFRIIEWRMSREKEDGRKLELTTIKKDISSLKQNNNKSDEKEIRRIVSEHSQNNTHEQKSILDRHKDGLIIEIDEGIKNSFESRKNQLNQQIETRLDEIGINEQEIILKPRQFEVLKKQITDSLSDKLTDYKQQLENTNKLKTTNTPKIDRGEIELLVGEILEKKQSINKKPLDTKTKANLTQFPQEGTDINDSKEDELSILKEENKELSRLYREITKKLNKIEKISNQPKKLNSITEDQAKKIIEQNRQLNDRIKELKEQIENKKEDTTNQQSIKEIKAQVIQELEFNETFFTQEGVKVLKEDIAENTKKELNIINDKIELLGKKQPDPEIAQLKRKIELLESKISQTSTAQRATSAISQFAPSTRSTSPPITGKQTLYAPAPQGGRFFGKNLKSTMKAGESMYRIEVTSDTEAYFYLMDDTATLKKAIRAQDSYIIPAMDVIPTGTANLSNYTSIQIEPGTLRKSNNNWEINKKGKIHVS